MLSSRRWRNRIVGYAEVDPRSLAGNPGNWRTHPEHQRMALQGVLSEVGWVADILVNQRTGFVVDGHLRVAAALARSESSVPVRYVDLEPEAERLVLATLDPITALAGSDSDKLAALLDGLQPADAAVADLLRELTPPRQKELNPDDADLTPPIEPITKPGDLWLLGEHRLLCGDATKAEDVEWLMSGERVNVIFTSPPYAEQRKAQYGGTPANEYVDWFNPVAANIANALAPDGSFFLNIKPHCEDGQRHLYVMDLVLAHVRKWGWRLVDEFCWKRNSVPGGWENRFKNAWEPVFHFSRSAQIRFCPRAVAEDTDAAFTYAADNPKSKTGFFSNRGRPDIAKPGKAYPDNVLEIGAETRLTEHHPAPFPVALPQFFIEAFSNQGDIAADPFIGSGTMLIAAEQLGRRCYAMEISPAYCDVAVRRWERVTGGQAVQTH